MPKPRMMQGPRVEENTMPRFHEATGGKAPGRWFICYAVPGRPSRLLHSDGLWLPATVRCTDGIEVWSGYYPSKEAAETALKAAIATGNLPEIDKCS